MDGDGRDGREPLIPKLSSGKLRLKDAEGIVGRAP